MRIKQNGDSNRILCVINKGISVVFVFLLFAQLFLFVVVVDSRLIVLCMCFRCLQLGPVVFMMCLTNLFQVTVSDGQPILHDFRESIHSAPMHVWVHLSINSHIYRDTIRKLRCDWPTHIVWVLLCKIYYVELQFFSLPKIALCSELLLFGD